MQHRGTVLLVSCLALGFLSTGAEAEQPSRQPVVPRTDPYGDLLPEGAIARLGSVRFHHQGGVIAAAFDPYGETLLAAGFEKEGLSLRFWDLVTGKERSRIAVKGFDLSGLAIAPDGQSVFVGRSNCVEFYDGQSGKLVSSFRGAQNGIGSFAVSCDGRWLATSSLRMDPVLHIWEVATGKERVTLKGQRGSLVKCQWSLDTKRLLCGTSSYSTISGNKVQTKVRGSLCIWDVAAAKKLHEIDNDLWNLALAPDCRTAAIQEQGGEIRIVNVATGRTTCRFRAAPSALEFTSDSGRLITVAFADNSSPCLWDATTGKEIRRFEGPHAGSQRLAGFSADSKWLAVLIGDWKQDGSVVVWNVGSGEAIHHAGGHRDTVTAVAFAPDGKLVASGSKDTTVRLWDLATSKELACLDAHGGGITALAFSVEGKVLAASGSDGNTRLWDVARRRKLARIAGPVGGATALTFAPDRKTLIASGPQGRIHVWELAGPKEVASFAAGSDDGVFALDRDGKLVLSAIGQTRDDQALEKLRLWKIPAGRQLPEIALRPGARNHDQIVCWAVALATDDRQVAVSHSRGSLTQRGTMYADHKLRVFERATGQELHVLPGVKVHALAFSGNGRLLAAGHGNNLGFWNRSQDSRITLWDMATGEAVREYKGHANEVACVAFSPDNKVLASGSADHTLLLWSGFPASPRSPGTGRPTPEQLASWWEDLKRRSAVGRPAMSELLAHPEATVPWIGQHLPPAAAVDTGRIARWIEGLDNSSFKEREKASAALEELGEVAERQLQQILAGKPTLEVRRRAELLLARLDGALLSPERLRMVRAVAVLEWIGNAQAQELLGGLSRGAPESRLTRLAKDALARIKTACR